MAEEGVRVIARFSILPNETQAFVDLARGELIGPTREEAGCRRYELWQDEEDPTRFVMVEEWESAEALEKHLAAPHLQAVVGKLRPLSDGPLEVSRFRKVG